MNPAASNYMSVSALSASIQRVMGDTFSEVYVRGEISTLKIHTSGHVYLTLKDEKSVIDAIIWKGTASRLKHKAEEGLEVLCYGRITTYPARSKYQLIINSFEPAGVGALLKLLEERKERLRKEGLFEPERKKALPFLPRKIGLITSETGAVLQDILHRLEERFPLPVMLCPVAVQGESSPQEVIKALHIFKTLPEHEQPDVIIIARGGGSLEDLWGFNDEDLARTVALFPIPIISAIGHETDTTLIDYVSDLRAPTPTAAAELAVPVRSDLLKTLNNWHQRLKNQIISYLQHEFLRLKELFGRLLHPKQALEQVIQRLDESTDRLRIYLDRSLEKKGWALTLILERFNVLTPLKKIEKAEEKLSELTRMLESLAPSNTLKRGYTMLTDESGKKVYLTQNSVTSGEKVKIQFCDGSRFAQIE